MIKVEYDWFSTCLSKSLNMHATCADHYSLDQFPCVETCLDDIGATEECVSLMLLCVVGTVSLISSVSSVSLKWVWEVGFCHRNTLT